MDMRNMVRRARAGCAALLAAGLLLMPSPAAALVPYENYTYVNGSDKALPAPQAYVPAQVLYGSDLPCGRFRDPTDLCAGPDGRLYLLDAGNARIIVLDSDARYLRTLSAFRWQGREETLHAPRGIFVDDKGAIYIAESDPGRILRMDQQGTIEQVFGAPVADIVPDNFIYKPVRVAADTAGRVYAISEGTYEGILQYGANGGFDGFIGANRVNPSLWDLFWKRIASDSMKDNMKLFLPVGYNSLAIDAAGFLAATTSDQQNRVAVRRLNPAGTDVTRNTTNNALIGDLGGLWFGTTPGASLFVDVGIRDNGFFSCLDQKRGRVFTYDTDGNLLYVFGGIGEQDGTFREPTALEVLGDRCLVLDRAKASVTIFRPTQYARDIAAAIGAHAAGDYGEAQQLWADVLAANSNFELSYVGLGKAELRQGDYRQAMEHFRLGNNRPLYSKALGLYRAAAIKAHGGLFFAGAALLLLLLAAFIKRKRLAACWRRRRRKREARI